jgi:hypothetical protein
MAQVCTWNRDGRHKAMQILDHPGASFTLLDRCRWRQPSLSPLYELKELRFSRKVRRADGI